MLLRTLVIVPSITVELIVTVLVVHLTGIHIAILFILLVLRRLLLILKLTAVLLTQSFLRVAVMESVRIGIEAAVLSAFLGVLRRVWIAHLVHLVVIHASTSVLSLRVANLALTSLAHVHALVTL